MTEPFESTGSRFEDWKRRTYPPWLYNLLDEGTAIGGQRVMGGTAPGMGGAAPLTRGAKTLAQQGAYWFKSRPMTRAVARWMPKGAEAPPRFSEPGNLGYELPGRPIPLPGASYKALPPGRPSATGEGFPYEPNKGFSDIYGAVQEGAPGVSPGVRVPWTQMPVGEGIKRAYGNLKTTPRWLKMGAAGVGTTAATGFGLNRAVEAKRPKDVARPLTEAELKPIRTRKAARKQELEELAKQAALEEETKKSMQLPTETTFAGARGYWMYDPVKQKQEFVPVTRLPEPKEPEKKPETPQWVLDAIARDREYIARKNAERQQAGAR